jgi:hypothetical protein
MHGEIWPAPVSCSTGYSSKRSRKASSLSSGTGLPAGAWLQLAQFNTLRVVQESWAMN